MWKLFLIFTLLVQLGVKSEQTFNNSTDCYETNDNKYTYFSTKTPYRLIRIDDDVDSLPGKGLQEYYFLGNKSYTSKC